jgi:hypothetical protein
VDSAQILFALERERHLLREFRSLSERQLLLLEDENVEGVQRLLDERSDLMLELSAIESTLGTWIVQIHEDPAVSPDMLHELRTINEEIVQLANQVVELDEQTHWRLDLIRQRAAEEMRDIRSGSAALGRYEQQYGGSNFELRL